MKIYLAGRYERREELCYYADILRKAGYGINSRWLNGTHQLHPSPEKVDRITEDIPEEACPFAQDDFEDVSNCHILILFSEKPGSFSGRGGRHVEFGIALALHKIILVVGPHENVFHRLPQASCYPSWEECFRRLSYEQEMVPDRNAES